MIGAIVADNVRMSRRTRFTKQPTHMTLIGEARPRSDIREIAVSP
ncbi:hypothetical protein [Beijerinckia sp. L45]|nr:hypothetical protein [Beijerinckia sp. L45]